MKEIPSWYPFVFHRNSDMISRFPDTNKVTIVDKDIFEENRDDLVKKWIDYNSDIDFFENFKILFDQTPQPNFIHYLPSENSNYTDSANCSKNAYLSNVVVFGCENVAYSCAIRSNVSNCYNSLYVIENSDNIYSSLGVVSSYNIFYSKYIQNSNHIYFSSNMIGCSECIFCDDLENASYYIENKKYDKAEYIQKKQEILNHKSKFLDYYKKVNKNGKNYASTNTTWTFACNSEDVENGSFIVNVKDARNCIFIWAEDGNENMYDNFITGASFWNDLYGVLNSWWSSHLYIQAHASLSNTCFYSYNLLECHHCIGCIGLKNKSYCIFNKQYSKEEWEDLANQIFSQMDQDWILWDFFPWHINPFYFNDTMAGILWNFTKEEVQADWYMWRDEEIRVDIPEGADVININELHEYQWYDTEWNWTINKDILKKVIKNEKGNYYRIVQMEYDFLVKHKLPLPDIHWLDRMKLNFWV